MLVNERNSNRNWREKSISGMIFSYIKLNVYKINYIHKLLELVVTNYKTNQIQPQLSTTTQLHHRHHVGNLENKKKVQEQDYF